MNGILIINKPLGMTSHDVVAKVRRILKTKSVGHTGTLDPGAQGVLPICVGRATKAAQYVTDSNKIYRAALKLGIKTDTADKYGRVLEEKDWKEFIDPDAFFNTIPKTLNSFVGKIKQVPPMYSAIKVNGQKLYNLARKGIEIERTAREIEIFAIKLIEGSKEEGTVIFDVECSKGTYIRTLCEDIGEKLGCGAHMSGLTRLAAGGFDIENSVTLEDLERFQSENRLDQVLIPVENIFINLHKINIVNHEDQKRFLNGADVKIDNDVSDGLVRVYIDQNFTALGWMQGGKVKVEKFFV